MDQMRICVIGTGYVGLVTGVCFADFGYLVTCTDIDEKKIRSLNNGKLPIYEPGLEALFQRNRQQKRIVFSTDVQDAVSKADVIFICVGTPPAEDGSADLSYVWNAARSIGKNLRKYAVVVDKSTVPVGTARKVKEQIQFEIELRGEEIEFDVVSNPEFLREGKAVIDFTNPDRVVIGANTERATDIMKNVYAPLKLSEVPFVITNTETAELIKYASNAFLATKISFINQMANLCENIGGDIDQLTKAVGMDGRIGSKFLHPGPGYGGSCFPKDTRALLEIGREFKTDLSIVSAVVDANESQKIRMFEKIEKAFDDSGIKNKVFAILGVTFKAETDDIRESPSLPLISSLLDKGANVRLFDPQGMNSAACYFSQHNGRIHFSQDEYEACKGAHAVVVMTEWNQFRSLDPDIISKLVSEKRMFDFRNMYKKELFTKLGFSYEGVGRK